MLFLLAFVAVATASGFTLHGEHWTKGSRASPSSTHSVVLGIKLKEGAADSCDSALKARALPESPLFGKHMTFKQVGDMFRNVDAEHRTQSWLRKNGVKLSEMRKTPNGEMIRVTTTVAKLEKLLGAEYYEYTAVKDQKEKIVRDLNFDLTDAMRSFLDFVGHTNTLPLPRALARNAIHYVKRPSTQDASGEVTPALLHSFYNITATEVANAGATQSLYESLGQSYMPSDLTSWEQQYSLKQTPIAKVIGPNTPSDCAADVNNCFEASLDVQQILSIAQGATTWYWSIPNGGEIFLDWIEAVTSTPNPPLIHSMSYASLQPEDPKINIERFNTELCKLGLKGLTLFVASGDDGVANFQARTNPAACGFTPSFPATSPYAVAVGGTQGPEKGNPEIACSSKTGGGITTGGGFSTFTKRPDYQDAAVSNYLQNGPNLPPRSAFSSQGRAYPDVAGLASSYPVLVNGATYLGSGTSASTPVVAGMFSLINGNRLAAGKAAVGWINPVLYQLGGNHSDIFNAITQGENNCCAGQQGSAVCCSQGFTELPSYGWSPVTGHGSINWAKANSYWTSLP